MQIGQIALNKWLGGLRERLDLEIIWWTKSFTWRQVLRDKMPSQVARLMQKDNYFDYKPKVRNKVWA